MKVAPKLLALAVLAALSTPALAETEFDVIGGSEIYAAFLPELDDLLVSHVFAEHEGDTRFPEFESAFPKSELVEKNADFEVRRWSRR